MPPQKQGNGVHSPVLFSSGVLPAFLCLAQQGEQGELGTGPLWSLKPGSGLSLPPIAEHLVISAFQSAFDEQNVFHGV